MHISTTTTTKIEVTGDEIKDAIKNMLSEKGYEVDSSELKFHVDVDGFFEDKGDNAISATVNIKKCQ